jgi:cyclophilin family peptidyl-prolyl cis-trans isomerase
MSTHFRSIPVLVAAAFALSSCSTVNNAIDRSMNVFRGKPQATPEEAVAVNPDGTPAAAAAPVAPKVKGDLRWNTVVMTVDINGVSRKVVIRLNPETAPKTVANFKKLVNQGFYDGLAFHRAIRNYIVQTGDPNTRSDDQKDQWGLSDVGYKLEPELKGTHVKGAVAMARPGALDAPDKQSSGSQFYVCLVGQKRLDGNYTVFGQVTHGLEVLEAVSAVSVDTNDTPTRRVNIKSIRLAPPDSPDIQKEVETPPPSRKTKPDSEKGPFSRLMSRFW